MGGLGAGIYLQTKNSNLKTVILEQHTQPGGYVTGFKRKGFYFDGGAEGIMGMDDSGSLRLALGELGFEHKFLREDPLEHYYYEDKEFSLYTTREALLKEIEIQYPDQKEGFERFLKRCKSIIQEQQNGKPVPEQNKPYIEFIKEFVTSEDIIDAFNLFCLWFGATPSETPAIHIAHIIIGVLEEGVFYPKGGMQAFSDHLADFYVQKGGKIVYKSMVRKIIMNKGRTVGVKLLDGITFEGKFIISNADVKKTILQYVGKQYFPEEYWQSIDELRQSVTGIMLFLGVDVDLSKYPSHFQIGCDLNVVEKVNNNEFTLDKLAIRIPSNIDPSLKSQKGDSLLAFIFQPYNWENYWRAGPNLVRGDEYNSYKEELTDKLITKIESVIPRLREHIIVKELATPLTFERYVQVTDGAWFGPFSFQELPSFKTPIDNLFLVGSSIKGSGVPSALRSGLEVGKYLLEKHLS